MRWKERRFSKKKKTLQVRFFYLNKKWCFSCNFCAFEWVNEQNAPLLPGSTAIPSIASLLLRHLHSAPLFCCPPFNFISFSFFSPQRKTFWVVLKSDIQTCTGCRAHSCLDCQKSLLTKCLCSHITLFQAEQIEESPKALELLSGICLKYILITLWREMRGVCDLILTAPSLS